MTQSSHDTIRLYTSRFCPHAWAVEQLLHRNEVAADVINIDSQPGARQELVAINGGYASVPTLIFPDGERLVEPPLRLLKQKLNIEETTLLDRIFGRLL
jgi:mycoredoxin